MNQDPEITEQTRLENYTESILKCSISSSQEILARGSDLYKKTVRIINSGDLIMYADLMKRKIKYIDVIWSIQVNEPDILLFSGYDNSIALVTLESSQIITNAAFLVSGNSTNIVHSEFIGRDRLILIYLDGSVYTYRFKLENKKFIITLLHTQRNSFEIYIAKSILKFEKYFFMSIHSEEKGNCLILYDIDDFIVLKWIIFGERAHGLVLSRTKALLGVTFENNFVLLDTRDFSLLLNGKGKKLFYSPGIIDIVFHQNCRFFSILKKGNKIDIFDLQRERKVRLYKRTLTKDFKSNQLLEIDNHLVILSKNYSDKTGRFVKYCLGDTIEEVVIKSNDDGYEHELGKVYKMVKFPECSRLLALTDDRKIMWFDLKEF